MIDAFVLSLAGELLVPALVLGFAALGVAGGCLLWAFCRLAFEIARGLRRERGQADCVRCVPTELYTLSGYVTERGGKFIAGGAENAEAFGSGRAQGLGAPRSDRLAGGELRGVESAARHVG